MFNINNSKIKPYIKDAVNLLQNREFNESRKLILDALSINPDSPEPHNLLGAWYEINGKTDLARKHYRAAYALDPTYKPAGNNLERLCTYSGFKVMSIDFGEEMV